MHSDNYESEIGKGDLESEAEREKWKDKGVAVIGVGSSAIRLITFSLKKRLVSSKMIRTIILNGGANSKRKKFIPYLIY